uniref:Sterile alpha motif domain containing 14 n=3 Tax=Erpetoichthys calabaricus TaxID=27687 RepID=A0A8C4SNP7_ERPCA
MPAMAQRALTMSSSKAGESDNVFDFNEAIPETKLLDSSLQKARAQLSVKARRHRPSRSRLRDSISSTEGDESLERKSLDGYGSPLHGMRSPLHSALRGSSPSPDSILSSSPVLRGTAFSFETSAVRRTLEEGETSPATARGRYQPLTNASSQEALGSTPTSSPSKSCPSSDSSPVYIRRERRTESEDDSRDTSPAEPGSPTVVLDKKTKRRFLDLGVTLRRSYGKGRKEKSNRLSVGNRDPSESPSRSSGSPFVPFSCFSDATKGSASSNSTPSCSPKAASDGFSPRKSKSQESTLSDDFGSPSPRTPSEKKSSHPYQTLSQSSDELLDEPLYPVSTWTTPQVCQWLKGLNMEQYITEFTARDVDGEQLLQLDGTKLKALGVNNSADRSVLKRRLKEMQAAVEKEKKALDKLERQKEKQRKRELEQRRS